MVNGKSGCNFVFTISDTVCANLKALL